MTWVRETAGKRIALCETESQLSSCIIAIRNDLARMISNREKVAYKDMDHFFETHELRDKFLMWRQYKMNALKHAATDFSDRAKKELQKREKSLAVEAQASREANGLLIMQKGEGMSLEKIKYVQCMLCLVGLKLLLSISGLQLMKCKNVQLPLF